SSLNQWACVPSAGGSVWESCPPTRFVCQVPSGVDPAGGVSVNHLCSVCSCGGIKRLPGFSNCTSPRETSPRDSTVTRTSPPSGPITPLVCFLLPGGSSRPI